MGRISCRWALAGAVASCLTSKVTSCQFHCFGNQCGHPSIGTVEVTGLCIQTTAPCSYTGICESCSEYCCGCGYVRGPQYTTTTCNTCDGRSSNDAVAYNELHAPPCPAGASRVQATATSFGHCEYPDGSTVPSECSNTTARLYDLRGRNITSFQDEAFTTCWQFPTSSHALTSSSIVGVLLDDNPLGHLPNGSIFGNALVVSMRNTSISSIPAHGFLGYSNPFFTVTVDLNDNQIESLGDTALSNGSSQALNVSVANNSITAVTQVQLASNSLVGLNLDANNVTAVPTANLSVLSVTSSSGLTCSGTQSCACSNNLNPTSACGYTTCASSACASGTYHTCTNWSVAPRPTEECAAASTARCAFHCKTSLCGPAVAFSEGNFNVGGEASYREQQTIHLNGRMIGSLQPGAFSCWPQMDAVVLDNNPLLALPNASYFDGTQFISLNECGITNLPFAAFEDFAKSPDVGDDDDDDLNSPAEGVFIFLNNNNISMLNRGVFWNILSDLSLSLVANGIATPLTPGLFYNDTNDTTTGSPPFSTFKFLDLSQNAIPAVSTAPLGFSGDLSLQGASAIRCQFNGGSATVCACAPGMLQNHGCGFLRCIGADGYRCEGYNVFANLSDCSNKPHPVCQLRAHSKGCAFRCGSSLCGGQVRTVAMSAWDGLQGLPNEGAPSELLDLRGRGITVMDANAFACWRAPLEGGALGLLLDHNPLSQFPNQSLPSFYTASLVSMANCSVTSLPPAAFASFVSPSRALVILDDNNITFLGQDFFANLSTNLYVTLRNNSLSTLTTRLFAPESSAGSLEYLDVSGNEIWATPTTANYPHARDGGVTLRNSPLSCNFTVSNTTFFPVAIGCTCAPGYRLSSVCQYFRCTAENDGCSIQTVINQTNCSVAPVSSCVNTAEVVAAGHEYYNRGRGAFMPLTDCATAFSVPGTLDEFQDAYEYISPTLFSDRQCSICSKCPSGYHTQACTATTNARCDRYHKLSTVEVAAVIAAVVVPTLMLVLALLHIRKLQQLKRTRSELGKTQDYLELTEQLLGDEREENERMEQAWTIEEVDLTFEDLIGQGSFGRVYRGKWGHIPVAIKVLRQPIDDLNPNQRADFDREVGVMRSIRHPHLLTFYGAGTNSELRPFLVTELMIGGSLRSVLLDHDKALDWLTRLSFVADAASGMAYLHDRGTVHRDLKADNCFVDAYMRVKVADFGAGRIISQLQQQLPEQNANFAMLAQADRARSLSQGSGSILWMPPEVLQCARITEEWASAIDVYSFAVVMWEVWTRAQPWQEIEGEGFAFVDELDRRLARGDRPRLPKGTPPAPEGYQELMERCWSSQPADRPPCSEAHDRLVAIIELVGGGRRKTVSVSSAASLRRTARSKVRNESSM